MEKEKIMKIINNRIAFMLFNKMEIAKEHVKKKKVT